MNQYNYLVDVLAGGYEGCLKKEYDDIILCCWCWRKSTTPVCEMRVTMVSSLQ